jgi:hypothetical protein
MKIDSYTIVENILTLHFDCYFRQISYIKMESNCISDSGTLECEEMEIKYSKNRNVLNTFIKNDSNTIVILITEFDNKMIYYSYYIKINTQITNNNQDNLLANGLASLLTSNKTTNIIKSNKINEVDQNNSDGIKICPIKNQNIFAKIKKKV